MSVTMFSLFQLFYRCISKPIYQILLVVIIYSCLLLLTGPATSPVRRIPGTRDLMPRTLMAR